MLDFRLSLINSTLSKVLKRLHYFFDVMLTCVRWHAAYPLNHRHIEEEMQKRGVSLGHVTVHRWAVKVLPVQTSVFRRRQRPVDRSWRMARTCVKVFGQWKYLYRAVNRAAAVVFLLNIQRDMAAAWRFLKRAIKQITRPVLGFKLFWHARIIIVGIESMQMIRRGQLGRPKCQTMSATRQLYSLAA